MRITDVRAGLVDVPMRMPFRYGIATMTSAVHAVIRLTLEDEGVVSLGHSGENLPPKWFTKIPDTSESQDLSEMLASILAAVEHAAGAAGDSVFDIWWQLQQAARAGAQGRPGLLVGLGVSLVERALLDAHLRRRGVPFHRALREGSLGFDAGRIHPELSGRVPADLLPATPSARISVRHTVGLGDKVAGASDRPAGLPVTLQEVLAETGVHHLKLKTQGDLAQDVPRLREIFEATARHGDIRFTIDGNESMKDPEHLTQWLSGLLEDRDVGPMVSRGLIAVEQPVHRSVALDESMSPALEELTRHVPIIIDESDDWPETLRTAMDLGYSGGSYKGCKGVFRGVANAMLVKHRDDGRQTLLTAEDLTTLPPFALNQDLAVAAALGLGHIERNGHHYFGRAVPVGDDVDRLLAEAHPDLFESESGATRLRIRDGELDLATINSAPFGLSPGLDLSNLRSLDAQAG